MKSPAIVKPLVWTAAIAMVAVIVPASPAAAVNLAPTVVPRLQQWTGDTGSLSITSSSRIVVDPTWAGETTSGITALLESPQTLAQTAERARQDILAVTGLNLSVVESTSSVAGDVVVTLAADPSVGTEGYSAQVGSKVTISAPATDGVFYGVQTLLQILRQSTDQKTLPKGSITDWPSLEYRAEHFDVSRRFMSVTEISDEIRRAAWNKLNVIQLMFNQANAFRLYSPDYAEAAPTDSANRYSESDIAQIEAVAAEYHVTLVPEIQNPTKMQPIATMGGVDRSLSTQCNDPSTIDFTNPTVVTWFQTLIEEFLPWFDGPYIHLGNDEVPTGLASCTYLTSQLGTGETIDDLQEEYIASLQTTVEAAGKHAMIWVNNTKIRPSTDVLIMNFGATSVSTTMRGLGYKVVDSAYLTGAYDRFYISPSDYEGKVVARGQIYNWTPAANANNAGQVLAMWGDDLFFSETNYFIEMFDGRRSELAERTWNSTATTASFATFKSSLTAIGLAPGVAPLASVAETTNGLPIHKYSFDAAYTPTAATHFPGGWKFSMADSVGTLHGNGWIFKPTYPVTGYSGSGLGFGAAADQSLNLGGYRIAGPWTLGAWLKRTADSTNTVLIRDMDYAIKVEQSGTANKIGISTYGGANYSFDYSAPLGTWVYLALTSDSAGTHLYANGSLIGSITQTIPLPLGGLGGRRSFAGVLDEVSVYAEALTAAEVSALYATYAGSGPVDIAAGKTATASSTNVAGREAAKAVDGNPATRWGSQYSDPQWISVDLGQTMDISRVRLNWETAYGKSYQVQVSDDGTTWTSIYSTTAGDGGVDDLTALSGSGRYIRVYGTQRGTSYGYSLWDFNVYGTPTDLAAGKTASASSTNVAGREPAKAVDNDPATRWGSQYSDPQWISVDMGQSIDVSRIRLNWEAAYGNSYQVQVSDDATSWTTIYSTTTGDGGVDDLTALSGSGRYVRVYGTQRGTTYGYSLWDLNVFGSR